MKCELTVSVLPLLLFPFANFAPEGGRKGDPGNEVAPLQLLLIPLCNALVLVCFSAILYRWIIPLTKEWAHIYIHTYNAMQDILANIIVQFKFCIWYH